MPKIAGALRLQGANDLQWNILVTDCLADGVAFGEQVLHDGLADNADFCHAVGGVIEYHAVFDFVVADFEVIGRNTGKRRGGVVVADNGLPVHGHHRGYTVDVGCVFADGDNIGFFERFGGFHLHAAAPVAVGHDDDGVRAHRGHLFLDGNTGTFAHGDHGNHGCDTDDDAEHREEGAHAVTEEGAESDFDKGNGGHGSRKLEVGSRQ